MSPSPTGRIEGSHFSTDTLAFIASLGRWGVRYVLVGGEAVIYYGYTRFTGDVDFFYSDRNEDVAKLFGALGEFWRGSIPGIESAAELAEPGVVVQFGRPPNRIDLLNRIDGVGFEEAWSSKLALQIILPETEVPVFMLDLNHLIRNKRAAGRPKDLDDLKYLESAAGQRKNL